MMEYKGYQARVDFDSEADLFHGSVVNTRDVITFQGGSVSELKQAFRDSVEDYLAFCKERGEEPDRPFSGKFLLRITPELHRDLHGLAARAGTSLNSWVEERLREAVREVQARAVTGAGRTGSPEPVVPLPAEKTRTPPTGQGAVGGVRLG